MGRFLIACLFLSLAVIPASAQLPAGFGIKGGLGVTDSFSPGGDPPVVFSQSATKDYIIGPTVDLRLPLGLSFEADALYRPASLEVQSVLVTNPTTNPVLSTTPFEKQRVNTFEFPLLVKYRLPVSRIKPVLEVGPSFRAGGSNNYLTYDLAHDGFTIGGGLEFKIPLARLSTDLRFTRWARSSSTSEATPNNNQVELLFGFSF